MRSTDNGWLPYKSEPLQPEHSRLIDFSILLLLKQLHAGMVLNKMEKELNIKR